jgi:segregation and condensation protein B
MKTTVREFLLNSGRLPGHGHDLAARARGFGQSAVLRLIYRPVDRTQTTRAAAILKSRRSRLEAVLLLAREPIAPRKLAQLANLTDGTEARTLIADLRARYDKRGCSFQIEQLAGGYQLLTRPKFAHWLRPVIGVEEEIRLSPPALETLSVVAYRQPVLRAEVESIRGVGCGEILRQLMDRDLLRIVGRSEELGRPLWYGTTKRFLEAFGLSHLDELPWAGKLRRKNSTSEPTGAAPSVAREFTPPGVSGGSLTIDNEAA